MKNILNETKTIREKIYQKLRKKIISGSILPGQSVNVGKLAKSFGVSVIPVREALFQLQSEKVIVVDSSRSFRVNALTGREMEEAFRIRLILEPLAAERACERRPESAVRKLNRVLESMKALVNNPKKFQEKNSQFHFGIYSYADSPLLLHVIDWFWSRIGPYLVIFITNTEDLVRSIDHHQDMFDAFASKDKDKIREALKQDLSEAAKYMIPYLEIHAA